MNEDRVNTNRVIYFLILIILIMLAIAASILLASVAGVISTQSPVMGVMLSCVL